ncbi:hypothetical protein PAXINDRAFT_103253 [Paxillus involutus ATCC 200175]|uniref:Amine oxidase n=1 Tax=Paxillus involutus ATCC 200175 TaxID=664439 RepID=A0A0C9TF02_PAXIN|nr:hypothetical protein PAXINDRAFT_103253 [Paxillus involutus ATCC 200175]
MVRMESVARLLLKNHELQSLLLCMSTEILRRDIIDVIDIRPFSQVKKQERRHHHRRHHLPVDRHAQEALQTLSNSNTALIGSLRPILNAVLAPFYLAVRALYIFCQRLAIAGWKQAPPPERIEHPYGRIAVIGAGLTGISSAAHAISHGFEVVIFEADDRVGGI